MTSNAQGARSYGAEFEGRYLLTPDDQFDASIDLLDAHFRNLVTGGIFGGDYSGYRLPFAPTISTQTGYQHSWTLSTDARITARAETHIESGSWVTFNHVENTRQSAYTLSNVFLTYDAPGRRWAVSAYVKNLENTAVIANGQSGPAGLETVDIGPPRTYGAQISAKF